MDQRLFTNRLAFHRPEKEEAGLGSLYDYGARFYSPYLNRFISADTIVPSPGNPQSLNRYAYALNNALKYTDPTGHCVPGKPGCGEDEPRIAPPTPVQPKPVSEKKLGGDPLPAPQPLPTPSIWLYPYTANGLLGYHQHQGWGTNDCGPTAVAIGMNLALGQPGHFTKAAITNWMTNGDYRWIAGATLPWDQARAINDMGATLGPDPFHAEHTTGTLDDLKNNLASGYPTLVTVIWDDHPLHKNGHVMVVAGYEQATDTWSFIDPGNNPAQGGGFTSYTTQQFSALWDRQAGHVWFRNGMVTIYPGTP